MPIGSNRYDAITDNGTTEPRKRVVNGEDDLQSGISFTVKYIGTQDVVQPHNRVDIVAAMRRIRFECKARGIKKQKIDLTVSVRGVKVVLFRRNRKKYQAENLAIIEHPIYRIFYVSHDSHDLLIFSYISREASTNQFRCNVFKAFKKSHAVDVVRTIGQAFDICHRIAIEAELHDEQKTKDDDNDTSDPTAQNTDAHQGNGSCVSDACLNPVEPVQPLLDSSNSTGSDDVVQRAQRVLAAANFKPSSVPMTTFKAVGTITSPMAPLSLALTEDAVAVGDANLSSQRQIQLLVQRQKELQAQQMHCLLSQMQLLKDQLAAETDARIEAQSRIHHLLGQNQDLLEHINALVQRLVQLEAPYSVKTQIPYLPTKIMTSVLQPVRYSGVYTLPRTIQSPINAIAVSVQNVSPDSGHREMSSDSLSAGGESTAAHLTLKSWNTFPASQTLGRGSPFDVKRSPVVLPMAKSLEISTVSSDFCASHCDPCSFGELPEIPDEKKSSEEIERNSGGEPLLSPWLSSSYSGPQKSSIMSVHSECKYSDQVNSDIVISSVQCDNTSVIVRESALFSNPTDNPNTPAGSTVEQFNQDNKLVSASFFIPGCRGDRGLAESVVAGNMVVNGSDVMSNNCHDNVWNQLGAVSLHSVQLGI